MARELSHVELEELLGAYALDAVDDDERSAVDVHLRECPRCRAEVADHREVAALLAHGGIAAPEGLWDRIAGNLDEPPPKLQLAPVVPIRRSFAIRAAAAVAAVAAILIGFLTVRVVQLGDRVDEQDDPLVAAAAEAFSAPGARATVLRSQDGLLEARAVVLDDGTGYLLPDNLRRLPEGRAYQLWAIVDGNKISAGVFGPDPDVVPFRISPDASALAVTEEVAGGVVETQRAPVVFGEV